ncbi:MAG: glycyl-radical enzyme activating protein [Clostridiales bacterium]|jgi:pyruvate formate lyase activating enzyme|nr:glycyl-radical enzyme activating protein [Clostridiales bacterium]
MKGIITEIMRFSLKDGPGIRTTVFLKGCNMACKWCHNPETLALAPQLMRYPDRCIGCGACLAVCEHGAFSENDGVAAYDPINCVSCGACADSCFSGALVMSGLEMSIEDVMAEVLQDADYYRNSGGGLTISGGEAASQPEFTTALLRAAKAAGIPTAIETNMLAEWPVYESMLPHLDLVMLDIKLSCDAAHKKWTGVGNKAILENVRRISETKPTIVRTPVIPGVNDTEDEIRNIAGIVRGLKNIVSFELLLYNPLGESKYEALGLEHLFKGAKPAAEGQAERLRAAAETAGFPVKVM